MSTLQIAFIIVGFILIWITTRLFYKERLTIYQMFFWNSIWIVLIVLSFFVSKLGIITAIFGIKRPADLFVYAAIVVLFMYTYKLNLKLELLNRNITKLTRTQAIKRATPAKKIPKTNK